MAPEVEILESGDNEPDSACSVWSNLASACLCNDTEISLFSLFNSCFAKTRHLRTKWSHQRPGRGKINEASVYFVPKVFDRTIQNLPTIQGEFNRPLEPLAETQLLSAPSQLHPVVTEVPLPPISPPGASLGSITVSGEEWEWLLSEQTCCSWFHYMLRPLPPMVVPNRSKSSAVWSSIYPILTGHTPFVYLGRQLWCTL